MENILILGGAGYTGSALAYLLVRGGYNVTVIDNFLFDEGVFNALIKYENLPVMINNKLVTIIISLEIALIFLFLLI